MRNYNQFLGELKKQNTPFDRLHYTSLLYLDKQMNDLTYMHLVNMLMTEDFFFTWVNDPESIKKFAESITLRRKETLRDERGNDG